MKQKIAFLPYCPKCQADFRKEGIEEILIGGYIKNIVELTQTGKIKKVWERKKEIGTDDIEYRCPNCNYLLANGLSDLEEQFGVEL